MLLAQSPTNVTVLPFTLPSRSSTVNRSASTCTGCPPSDRPLMTGTADAFAKALSRSSPKVRNMMQSA